MTIVFQQYRYRNWNLLRAASAVMSIALVWPGSAAFADSQTHSPAFVVAPATFAGKVLLVSSDKGDVPVRFSQKGTITGSTRGHDDAGKWWISQQKLCLQWQTWLDAKPHCISVEPVSGPVLRWHADTGEEGIAYFMDAVSASR
jgi:hypothetical protein